MIRVSLNIPQKLITTVCFIRKNHQVVIEQSFFFRIYIALFDYVCGLKNIYDYAHGFDCSTEKVVILRQTKYRKMFVVQIPYTGRIMSLKKYFILLSSGCT